MAVMSLEDWKKAYRELDPGMRKEFARWILDQELGSAPGTAPAPRAGSVFPVRGVVLLALSGLVAFAGWRGVVWKQGRDAERARMTAVEREAEEAKRPRSPKNMEFLKQNVGREVTVTGVPEQAEVGFLYFGAVKKNALRLNLMPGGVVLMQSGELEDLVAKKTGITVTGVLESTEEGFLEIKITSLGQMKRQAP